MDAPAPAGLDGAASAASRIALVEDHEIAALGFAQLLSGHPDFDLVATASTVAGLDGAWPVDLVVLDLRLSDGSEPGQNAAKLRACGAEVLVLTAGDSPALVRQAARANILGMVRKSEPAEVILDAVRAALRGETVATTEWAAAIDADAAIADAGLSPREREVLALYASGQKAQAVAYRTGLSRATVTQYLSRIRTKYAMVGRHAPTKIDLNQRAREDGLLP